jgi:hypothetical protein
MWKLELQRFSNALNKAWALHACFLAGASLRGAVETTSGWKLDTVRMKTVI